MIYFTIASLWGFLVGTAALLGGLVVAGRPLSLSLPVALALALAAAVALVGGFVASSAYRQATDPE